MNYTIIPDMEFISNALGKCYSILRYYIRKLFWIRTNQNSVEGGTMAQGNDIIRVRTHVHSNGARKRFVGIQSGLKTSVSKEHNERLTPRSVNYHFTRQCNYKCGFCFHTAKSSYVLPIEEAKRGLKMLTDAGMEKINFSGGEPFIHQSGNFLGKLVKYCKEDLGLPSVTIVSNGSLIKEVWFEKYGEFLDILAISVDSFDPEINSLIGRQHGSKQRHLETLNNVRDWCTKYKVAFKINTVVNVYNKDEDMTFYIQQLKPCRWKVFQCLLLSGENSGPDAIRNAATFVITVDEFQNFLKRHSCIAELVPESNQKMQNSYLILDERMRFLDCTGGGKTPSRSLLDVGVEDSINDSGFDEEMFLSRGGKYTWSKKDLNLTDW